MATLPLRFETLIERHHDEIYSYLWRLSGSAADAEDLTQEVFLRAYQAYGRLRPDSNHRAWLYKIATNCAYTALKRNSREAQHTIPLLDEYVEHSTLNVRRETSDEIIEVVRQAIAALPARQKEALVLRHVQGLEYAEVAHILGCSEDSARANVYQAIRRLRRELNVDVQ
jgi:RNA polymerase sigma-70 factor (ECF subfamily)